MESILDELGLQKSLAIEHLSQGLRRRLQLASALVAKAKIYVLDDPTVGLDDYAVECLMPSIVSELANRGAVLLSTKEGRLIEVLSLLDKVKVIHALKYSRMATKI
ncbi:MAG: ATP-binding cassette domain-containing protein [Thermofilaceae archaeon]